jgi:membrane-bound metal-dependent hydrolase YbcI (DUF457 family)
VRAFPELKADLAVKPSGRPVALAHDALDFLGCYDERSFYHSLFFWFLSLWALGRVLYVRFKYTLSMLYVYFILVSFLVSVKVQKVVGDWQSLPPGVP